MSFSWLVIKRYDAKLRVFNWERENWHWYSFHSSLSAHVLLPGSDLSSWLTWCSGQLSVPSWWQWGFPHRCDATCQRNSTEGRPGIKNKWGSGFFLIIFHHCALFLHPEHNLLMVKGFELSNSWPQKSFPSFPIIQSLILKIYPS